MARVGPSKGWREWFWEDLFGPAVVGLLVLTATVVFVQSQTATEVARLRTEAVVANATSMQRSLIDAVVALRPYADPLELIAGTEFLRDANAALYARSEDAAGLYEKAIEKIDNLCQDAYVRHENDEALFRSCMGVRVLPPGPALKAIMNLELSSRALQEAFPASPAPSE